MCGGKAVVDKCGVCGGNNKDLGCDGKCFSLAVEDCLGVCNGEAARDDCGVCGVRHSALPVAPLARVCSRARRFAPGGTNLDKGCDAVCFSGKTKDCKGALCLASAPPGLCAHACLCRRLRRRRRRRFVRRLRRRGRGPGLRRRLLQRQGADVVRLPAAIYVQEAASLMAAAVSLYHCA